MTSPRPLRVSVVTPVLNAEALIGETVRSVIEQTAVRSGRVELDYVVADGQSSDTTCAIAEQAGRGIARVQSRPDEGMYDALTSTWSSLDDESVIMAYLNAGDVWQPTALDVVLDVMQATGARWVCGQQVTCNHLGQATRAVLPFRYRRRLIRAGVYGEQLPWIQQESTFWAGSLLSTVDLARLRTFRLAGDQFLWSCFATEEEPVVVEAILGGFREHEGQLSEDQQAYEAERRSFTDPPTGRDRLVAAMDRIAWSLPPRVKKALNPGLLQFDRAEQRWV